MWKLKFRRLRQLRHSSAPAASVDPATASAGEQRATQPDHPEPDHPQTDHLGTDQPETDQPGQPNNPDHTDQTDQPDQPTSDSKSPSITRPAPSRLEELPYEMQRLIMSQASTLDVLSALVHASPQLHRVYVQDRLHILRGCLEQSFGDMIFDVHAAYVSGTDDFQMNREESMLWDFVNNYQQKLGTSPASLISQLPLEDIIDIARFHTSIIEPLTKRYAIWTLAAMCSSPESQPLSDTERRRIQRGLYRLQIFCNVCGSRGEGRSIPRRIEDEIQRVRILSFFPAWQVEEILCVNQFATDIYGGLFDRVAWDLDEERNPKYSHISLPDVNETLLLFSPGPEYSTNLNERPLNIMLRNGLTLLSTVLNTTDHDTLVELVRTTVIEGMHLREQALLSGWIDEAVWQDNQDRRREGWYSEYDAAQDSRQKMIFEGDRPDTPPVAWVRFWKGQYSNLFGSWVPQTLRRWGYIMWDAARVDESGANELLELEFPFRTWDPREEYAEDIERGY